MHALSEASTIRSYLEQLTNDRILVKGQLTKLERIHYGISFLLLVGEMDNELKNYLLTTCKRIKKWQSVLRRKRTGIVVRREEEATENPPNISGAPKLLSNSVYKAIEEIISDGAKGRFLLKISDKLVDLIPSYLFAILINTNSQRQGAVPNFDMSDNHKQKEVEKDGKTFTLIKVIATT